jgi:hypothetical protein
MRAERTHPPDERLLRFADGELELRDAAAVRNHLAGCAPCRERLHRLEASAAAFQDAYRSAVPPATAAGSASRSRETLKTQLSEIAAEERRAPSWIVACTLLIAALAGVEFVSSRTGPLGPARADAVRPIAYLTPGATRPVSANELCTARRAPARHIPSRVRYAIVRDYGMEHVSARDYELDYLITPELGGADDRRNLWPERYSSDEWNARVKDELEHLLPRLVCAGVLPLETAQRDLATDWVAAYKKYFQTDRPLHAFPPQSPADADADEAPDLTLDIAPFELPAPRRD